MENVTLSRKRVEFWIHLYPTLTFRQAFRVGLEEALSDSYEQARSLAEEIVATS